MVVGIYAISFGERARSAYIGLMIVFSHQYLPGT